MKLSRQKALAMGAAGLIGLLAIYALLKSLVLSPVAALEAEARSLRDKDANLQRELTGFSSLPQRLAALRTQTLGQDEDEVSELMRARLVGLLAPSGLDTQQFGSSPLASRRIGRKGEDREISRSVNLKAGKLSHAINLLYLLSQGPELHRLETIVLKPSGQGQGRVDLSFKYSTLSLGPVRGAGPASRPASEPAGTLETPQRQLYETLIAQRDILRPFVRRPEQVVVQAPPPPPEPRRETPRGPSEPPEAYWRLVGLSKLFGTDFVSIRNRSTGEVQSFKVGDPMAGGQIVMIDSRPMPRRDNPQDFTECRVILKVRSDYWAVEIGESLADKRRLMESQLPGALRRLPASAPAEMESAKADRGNDS